MFKNISIILMFVYSFFIWITTYVFADTPDINWFWLPGNNDSSLTDPWTISTSTDIWIKVITSIIWETIQIVSVVAVIALIISWIMYLISWWEEEKTKRAKTWIIWSLAWVILSISAWWIVNVLNDMVIDNF